MTVASGFSLSVLEKKWFSEHVTGTNPRTPLNDLKRRYYVSQVGSGASTDLTDLEKQWLRKDITNNGGTPTGESLSDLWIQAIATRSLRVSKFIDENRQTYYRNVA
jgi:hypothetical protein